MGDFQAKPGNGKPKGPVGNAGEAGREKKPVVKCFKCGQLGHLKSHCMGKDVMGQKAKCYSCGEEGHKAFRCPSGLVCHWCRARGHTKRECLTRTRDLEARGKQKAKGGQIKSAVGNNDVMMAEEVKRGGMSASSVPFSPPVV